GGGHERLGLSALGRLLGLEQAGRVWLDLPGRQAGRERRAAALRDVAGGGEEPVPPAGRVPRGADGPDNDRRSIERELPLAARSVVRLLLPVGLELRLRQGEADRPEPR